MTTHSQYDNPLISRCASPEMNELSTPRRKFSNWHRRLVGTSLGVGIICCLSGVGLMAASVLMVMAVHGRIANSGVTLPPQEVAIGIANASPYWSIGVPFAAVGAAIAILSGIVWFLTRSSHDKCCK